MIFDKYLDEIAIGLGCNIYSAVRLAEFDRIYQQVSYNLLQPNAITGDRLVPDFFGEVQVNRNIPFGSFGFCHFDRTLDKFTDPNGFHFKPELTRDHSRDIKQVFDQTILAFRVLYDRLYGFRSLPCLKLTSFQEACPTENGIERCPKLMGNSCHKLVS